MAAPKSTAEWTADDWTLISGLLKEEVELLDQPAQPGYSKTRLTAMAKNAHAEAERIAAESKPPDDKPADEPEPTPVTPEKDDSGEPQEPTTPVPPDAAVPA